MPVKYAYRKIEPGESMGVPSFNYGTELEASIAVESLTLGATRTGSGYITVEQFLKAGETFKDFTYKTVFWGVYLEPADPENNEWGEVSP